MELFYIKVVFVKMVTGILILRNVSIPNFFYLLMTIFGGVKLCILNHPFFEFLHVFQNYFLSMIFIVIRKSRPILDTEFVRHVMA